MTWKKYVIESVILLKFVIYNINIKDAKKWKTLYFL